VSNGTYDRNFGIGVEHAGKYNVTASLLGSTEEGQLKGATSSYLLRSKGMDRY
jgi:hypothetical protein